MSSVHEEPVVPIPVSTDPIRRVRDGVGVAVLLVHGLSGNPFEVGLLADHLFNAGYSVVAPRLCGHYDPDLPLNRAKQDSWVEQVFDEYRLLAELHERVVVVGHSMGTLLALLAAAEFPSTTPGIVLIAPPIYTASRAAEWAIRRLRTRGIDFRNFGIPGKPKELKDVAIREIMPKAKFIPFNAVFELADLRDRALAVLPEIAMPILAIFSKKDKTVSMRGLDYLRKNAVKASLTTVVLEQSSHIIPLDIERRTVFSEVDRFISDCLRPGV